MGSVTGCVPREPAAKPERRRTAWAPAGFAQRPAWRAAPGPSSQVKRLIPRLPASDLTARFRPRLPAMHRGTHTSQAGSPRDGNAGSRTAAARTSRALGPLVLILGIALLGSGCSTDNPLSPGPTSPGRADATVTLPGTTATSPTARTIDVLTDMPPAARERTDAGVEAFVRYFYDSANNLAMHPRTGEIAKLCDTQVLVCAQWEKALGSYADRDIALSSPIFRVTATEASRGAGNDPDGYLVTTVLIGENQVLRATEGGTPSTSPGRGQIGQVIHVSWRDGHWWITDIDEVS